MVLRKCDDSNPLKTLRLVDMYEVSNVQACSREGGADRRSITISSDAATRHTASLVTYFLAKPELLEAQITQDGDTPHPHFYQTVLRKGPNAALAKPYLLDYSTAKASHTLGLGSQTW